MSSYLLFVFDDEDKQKHVFDGPLPTDPVAFSEWGGVYVSRCAQVSPPPVGEQLADAIACAAHVRDAEAEMAEDSAAMTLAKHRWGTRWDEFSLREKDSAYRHAKRAVEEYQEVFGS